MPTPTRMAKALIITSDEHFAGGAAGGAGTPKWRRERLLKEVDQALRRAPKVHKALQHSGRLLEPAIVSALVQMVDARRRGEA
mgnify:CR=1 FL=1